MSTSTVRTSLHGLYIVGHIILGVPYNYITIVTASVYSSGKTTGLHHVFYYGHDVRLHEVGFTLHGTFL